MQCTEGRAIYWECDLGLFMIWGLNFFFLTNNGLGAFLEPNWKVFHHETLRKHFQGVCVAIGSLPISEKMEYAGRKLAQLFHLTEWQQDVIDTCKGYQIDRHEKFCQYMPRNIQKVKFLTDFKCNFSNFYDFLENFWIQKAGKKKVIELRWKNQGETLAKICQKALSASNSTQLYELFKAGLLNADNDKKRRKMTFFNHEKCA